MFSTLFNRRVRGLMLKETYQIFRDPSSILIAFILPLMQLFFYAYALNLDATKLHLGIVVEDTNPLATTLIGSFQQSPFFKVHIGKNRQELEPLIQAQKLEGVLIIPQNFTQTYVQKRKPAELQLITNGIQPNTASLLENYVRASWVVWQQQYAREHGTKFEQPIEVTTRIWYNPEALSRNFILPGSLAIIMTIIGTLLTSMVIAREWERGTMEALLATPMTIREFLIGKLVPYMLLAFASLLLSTALCVFAFDVPFRGSFLIYCLVSLAYMLTSLSLGLWISTISRNQFDASQIAIYVAFLPAFLLSGFLFEIRSMPVALQFISSLLPPRYYVPCLQTLFLAGNVYSLLAWNVAVILLIGGLILLRTKSKLYKRLE